MAQLTVKLNGYAYNVGCEDGQEAHLLEMARQVEQRIESIKALGGQSGESRLLLLAALLMADELHDTAIELASLRQPSRGAPLTPAPAAAAPAESAERADARTKNRIAKLARKAEDIAASIDPS
jgi:cell division protein ZapA